MRRALQDVIKTEAYPDHAGLAYDIWSPIGAEAKRDEERPDARPKGLDEKAKARREVWFGKLEKLKVPQGYPVAFRRWERALRASGALVFVAQAKSRLLVGHGNPAPTEVGLTLHRTWGVPMIPGSALKGLLAHYVRVTYGPAEETAAHPRDPQHREPDRAAFQGVIWDGKRLVQGPGDVYRRIFGAPDVDGSNPLELGARRGKVVFEDALWVPDQDTIPLARDILTVHQKSYYRSATLPNDYDEPQPITFLSVRPGAHFLIALSGPPDEKPLLLRAQRYLEEALEEWGIGGKTAAGYGRLARADDAGRGAPAAGTRAAARPEAGDVSGELAAFEAWLDAQQENRVDQRSRLDAIEAEWIERLRGLPPSEVERARRRIVRSINSPKMAERRDLLLSRLAVPR